MIEAKLTKMYLEKIKYKMEASEEQFFCYVKILT